MAAGPGRHVRCVSPGPTAPRVGRGELVCKTGPWYLPRIFLILSDFVVHSLRPPKEEAMSRLWSQLGWYSKPLRSWNGVRRGGTLRGGGGREGWQLQCERWVR